MRQITFACQPSFEKFASASRREQFLQTMETVVPWSELEVLIARYYPKAGKGSQPVGLGIMLRIYFLQHWFNLSDPGAEDALYDAVAALDVKLTADQMNFLEELYEPHPVLGFNGSPEFFSDHRSMRCKGSGQRI